MPFLPPDPPPAIFDRALAAATCATGERPHHLLLADMTLPSRLPRLWVLDLSDAGTPVVKAWTQVAHGAGSDPFRTGRALQFGDTPGSGRTALGLYRIAEPYAMARHGKAFRLDGLSDTDRRARMRGVVLHAASYVRTDGAVGRSLGCPALNPATFAALDRQALLAGALLWIDGGAAPLPGRCAAPKAWTTPRASTVISPTSIWGTSPRPACRGA